MLSEVMLRLPEIAGVLTAAELTGLCDPARYTGAAGALVEQALSAPDDAPE
ncbi:hypothetical protein [Peterkaempfera sp. SMS 1(5)a]|uniref:hypothetical protein n=1 Tax=Peterkaempfera podocarpi TaxID=3232308 RepID=UPI00366C613A